jgi:GNAT superfamily N-acetyltransferase
MSIIIQSVNGKKDIKKFIDFPHTLYATDPNYVPELYVAQSEMMDKKKYPFFDYAETEQFLAYKDDKIVGRICAIDNKRYNEYHKSNVGFFGFLDFIDDYNVLEALMKAASDWLKKRGFNDMIGPTNYSTNETAGVLVDGYDRPPMIMMTYNAPYYSQLLEKFGCKKEMDLYAYMILTADASEKSIRIADALEARLAKKGITIRNINLKKLKQEAEKLKEVYNSAWENNWGFVPFTDKEFDHLRESLGMIADKDYLFIAEKDGKAIGFGITLPDINEVTRTIKKGRLFPTGIFKILFNKSKVKYVRVLALGVVEEYRRMGIEGLFFAKNILMAKKRNHLGGEASWILESNEMMVKAAEHLNGKRYKTYRLYRKSF